MAWNRYIKLHGRAKEISAILVEFKRQTRGFFCGADRDGPPFSWLFIAFFGRFSFLEALSIAINLYEGKATIAPFGKKRRKKGEREFRSLSFFSPPFPVSIFYDWNKIWQISKKGMIANLRHYVRDSAMATGAFGALFHGLLTHQ